MTLTCLCDKHGTFGASQEFVQHSLYHFISPLFHMGLQTLLAARNTAKAITQALYRQP